MNSLLIFTQKTSDKNFILKIEIYYFFKFYFLNFWLHNSSSCNFETNEVVIFALVRFFMSKLEN